jgi:beta-N-acetylhexosaminidase
MSTKSSSDLRARVGQLMIMGFDGTGVSTRLRTMLATFQPGGVILFKRNIAEAAQTHALLRDAQKAVATPMFRSVDMEGGTVDRFRDVIARIPSAAEVAESGSTKLFRKHGKVIGQQIRALGFNTDFAPCVDLRLDESLSVLGSRTVSADPHEGVRYARAFLSGLQDAHVIGCGKHFPGLGGANLDSHRGLPSIDRSWDAVWNHDLVPYREMRKEFPFVMVAHVAYSKIMGNATPASLSKEWIEGVLRKRIGYRGLVISDDLDMGGVLNGASIEEAAVETLLAGSDMFLVCQKEEHVWRAWEAVFTRAEADKQFSKLVAEKARRVTAFKTKSAEVAARMTAKPTAKTVETLRRRVWEFTEELRLSKTQMPPRCEVTR